MNAPADSLVIPAGFYVNDTFVSMASAIIRSFAAARNKATWRFVRRRFSLVVVRDGNVWVLTDEDEHFT